MVVMGCLRLISALFCATSVHAFVPPASGLLSQSLASHHSATRTPPESRRVIMSVATRPMGDATTGIIPTYPIKTINSHDDFLASMVQSQNKLVVVNFFDKFCRACDEINPKFEKMALDRNDDASFYRVEFSTNKSLCKQLGIQRLPTVQMYAGSLGRVEDMPAGPSRFSQVEVSLNTLLQRTEIADEFGREQ
ncbi:unnamed protein product [Choristocarpus tenellus]